MCSRYEGDWLVQVVKNLDPSLILKIKIKIKKLKKFKKKKKKKRKKKKEKGVKGRILMKVKEMTCSRVDSLWISFIPRIVMGARSLGEVSVVPMVLLMAHSLKGLVSCQYFIHWIHACLLFLNIM